MGALILTRNIRAILLAALSLSTVAAQPSQVSFSDCTSPATLTSSSYDPAARINISSVFAQIVNTVNGTNLKLDLVGATGKTIIPSQVNGDQNTLTTLLWRSSVLTFTVYEGREWFCESATPPSPLPALNASADTFYCPISAGEVAFSVSSPLQHNYNLTTIMTRVRVIDPSPSPGVELACIDVQTTPTLDTHPVSNPGIPQILFWLSVSLVIGYWVVIGIGRISAAWGRGASRNENGWSNIRWAGTVLTSAVGGERLSTHNALLRFATPSYREVLFHTQWCATLIMVAVEWPRFAYPILSNAAWTMLAYNITLQTGGNIPHWDTHSVVFAPPSEYADQMNNPSSPLYLDPNAENQFYLFPPNTYKGMSSFARSIGLRPQDVFGNCLKIWIGIVASAVVLSSFIWVSDWFVSSCVGGRKNPNNIPGGLPHVRFSGGIGSSEVAKDPGDLSAFQSDDELGFAPAVTTRSPPHKVKRWWHYRLGQSSFHGSVLSGNLVRLLILFYLPMTIFTSYEFTRQTSVSGDRSHASFILAILCFVFLSIIIPAVLLARLALTPTKKLYDATRTLLALGPLYSHYAQGSQMFAAVVLAHQFALGVVVGVGQRSGTAQAMIILVLEVASALATSIWLPWGERANMGVVSFALCVTRIVTAVLLIILTPLVSVGDAAGGWIAYAIIVIQALVYLGFLLLFISKFLEGLVRLVGRVPFRRSHHSGESGLLGAMSLAGCFGARRKHRHRPAHRAHPSLGSGDARSHAMPASTLDSQASNRPMINNPQSFLRPEHALLPYREDADDESGYIMDAWQPYNDPYHPYDEPTKVPSLPSTPGASTSGFTRVGGGRAHMDSPFAISMGAKNGGANAGVGDGLGERPDSSGSSVPLVPPRQQHQRMQSQAAIIEESSRLAPPRRGTGGRVDVSAGADGSSSTSSTVLSHTKKSSGFWGRRQSSSLPLSGGRRHEDDEDDDFSPGPSSGGASHSLGKWFGRGGGGRKKSEDFGAPVEMVPEEPSQPSSFTVVRNKRPSQPPSASATPPATAGGPSSSSVAPQPATERPDTANTTKSFVVVRDRRSSTGPAIPPRDPRRDSGAR